MQKGDESPHVNSLKNSNKDFFFTFVINNSKVEVMYKEYKDNISTSTSNTA